MGEVIDLELARARRDQKREVQSELEQLAREEGITVDELVRRLAEWQRGNGVLAVHVTPEMFGLPQRDPDR